MKDRARTLGRVLVETALYTKGYLRGRLHGVNPAAGPRVAFQAFSIHLAQFFKPVIEELRVRDPAVEVQFIALPHPHIPRHSWRELATYARDQLGVPERNVYFWWKAIWERFDIVLYGDTYAKFPKRSAANVLLCHGPVAQRRDFNRGLWHKASSDLDAVLVAGPYDQKQFEAAHQRRGAETAVHVLGFPFLDSLVHGLPVSRDQYFARLGIAPGRRTILFAPHWKVLDVAAEKGVNYLEDVLATLLETGSNVVVKFHAYSVVRATRAGTRQVWLPELAGHERVVVDRDIDDRPALQHCDLLVGDISSRAFAFMLLGKPVVTYRPFNLDWDVYAARRNALRGRGSFVASSPAELRRIVAGVQQATGCAQAQMEVARECFSHVGCASAKVADWVLQEIEHGAPALFDRGGRGGSLLQNTHPDIGRPPEASGDARVLKARIHCCRHE